jgi:CO/xanthine dehydrogenase FAD-binding subunit
VLTGIESYDRPTSLDEAWELVQRPGARIVAGGTDLVVQRPAGVTALVDLAGLDLAGIDVAHDGSMRIGAMTTFTQMLEHPGVVRAWTGVLGEMLVDVGSVLHRNSATLGGHIVRARLSDVIPVLLALDAHVELFDGESKTSPLAQYLAADSRGSPHVVTAVALPAEPPVAAAAFLRFARTGFDVAQLNCACRVDLHDGRGGAARVVIGELGALARRFESAEQALLDRPVDDAAIAAAVAAVRMALADVPAYGMGADYRTHLAGIAVQRCLERVAERLGGGRR